MDFNNNNVEIPNLGSALAINALDSIPNTKPDAKQIVALVKKRQNYWISVVRWKYRLQRQGVALAKSGDIASVGIAHRKDTEYLKSIPDGTDDNNLSNLPTV